MPVRGPRCHTDHVMQGVKTTVRICNTIHRWYACRHGQRSLSMPACAVAYLLAADNSIGPLLSRLRGAQQPVVRPRNAFSVPCSHLLARLETDPSRSFARPSSWPTFYRACSCGHGGTRNSNTSLSDHT